MFHQATIRDIKWARTVPEKRMSQILSGLDGVVCLIDDILVTDKHAKEHDERLLAALQRIRDARVTLN